MTKGGGGAAAVQLRPIGDFSFSDYDETICPTTKCHKIGTNQYLIIFNSYFMHFVNRMNSFASIGKNRIRKKSIFNFLFKLINFRAYSIIYKLSGI